MECKCSVPGRIVIQLRDTQHRSIVLHLSKQSCLEQKATEVFLPNTSLQYLKAHGAEEHVCLASGKAQKSLAFVYVSNVTLNVARKSVWVQWDSRNRPISLLFSSSGSMPPLCLQTRQSSSKLSSKLSKIEFVLPHKLPGPHWATTSCVSRSATASDL